MFGGSRPVKWGETPQPVGVCPTRRAWASQIRRRGDAEGKHSPPHHLAGDDETLPWKDEGCLPAGRYDS